MAAHNDSTLSDYLKATFKYEFDELISSYGAYDEYVYGVYDEFKTCFYNGDVISAEKTYDWYIQNLNRAGEFTSNNYIDTCVKNTIKFLITGGTVYWVELQFQNYEQAGINMQSPLSSVCDDEDPSSDD